LDIDAIHTTATEAARAAGRLLLQNQDLGAVVEKSAYHFVTEADLRSERAILDLIQARFPDHQIVSEESFQTGDLDGEAVWIIDPLDGTNNFSHSIPLFCVSIAFAARGQVQAAAIYDPSRDELFSAICRQGAFLNGRPIRVSANHELRQAIVCTGFYYDRDLVMRGTLKAIEQLFVHGVRGIRRLGSAALDLCWVAAGRLDAFFEYRLAPWDYAAGWLIVREAGGTCSDRDGNPMHLRAENVVAANPPLHGRLLETVRWSDMERLVAEKPA
jgi:myo-inositol-1(or 4)-monophosphatase